MVNAPSAGEAPAARVRCRCRCGCRLLVTVYPPPDPKAVITCPPCQLGRHRMRH